VELGQYKQNTNIATPILSFGDVVAGTQTEANIQVDYLRWDLTGAYAPTPIPEPTFAGLAAAGIASIALCRRHRT
jgi:hypothetical protein